jgi:hypothetical protein
MKKILSISLICLMLQSIFCFGLLPNNVVSQTQEKLTNQNIIDLVKSGFANEIIIAKIKSSATAFDTSLTALQELRNNNIANEIIVIMVEANKPITDKNSPKTEITVPDGTEIGVVLKNDLSSESAKAGDIVYFSVERDIIIDGITVVNKDALATGKIAVIRKAGYWGRRGKLGWVMVDVTTVSGAKIPIRFTKDIYSESRSGRVAISMAATAVLFFPAAPFMGLKKGDPAVVSLGNYYAVYVDGTAKVKVKM